MNAVVHPISHPGSSFPERHNRMPSQVDAEDAFRSVLRWIGEDPERDGLRETPGRLVRAFQE